MPQLEKKCAMELRKGSVVAACRFPFPEHAPQTVIGEGLDTVWVYSNYGSSPVMIANKRTTDVSNQNI